jgi:hypothetical protein
MILTDEDWSTELKTCPNVTFSTTNPTLTSLRFNLGGLCCESPAT